MDNKKKDGENNEEENENNEKDEELHKIIDENENINKEKEENENEIENDQQDNSQQNYIAAFNERNSELALQIMDEEHCQKLFSKNWAEREKELKLI